MRFIPHTHTLLHSSTFSLMSNIQFYIHRRTPKTQVNNLKMSEIKRSKHRMRRAVIHREGGAGGGRFTIFSLFMLKFIYFCFRSVVFLLNTCKQHNLFIFLFHACTCMHAVVCMCVYTFLYILLEQQRQQP